MHALPPQPAVLWVLVVAKFLRAPEVCLGAACVCAQSYYLDQQLKRHIQSYHMDC